MNTEVLIPTLRKYAVVKINHSFVIRLKPAESHRIQVKSSLVKLAFDSLSWFDTKLSCGKEGVNGYAVRKLLGEQFDFGT